MKRTMIQLISNLEEQLTSNCPYSISQYERNNIIFDLLELGGYDCISLLDYFPVIDFTLPPTNSNLLTVYRVKIPSTTTYHPFSAWTTNFNFALLIANKQKLGGIIYQGKVPPDKLLALIHRRNALDIIVNISDVQEIVPVPSYTCQDFPYILSPNLIQHYHYFSNQLNDNWFAQKSNIHGRDHTLRVLLFALIINELEYLQAENILSYCALLHDIGRVNDHADPSHGEQSAKRIIEKEINLPGVTEEEFKIIKFIIISHSIDDHQIILPDDPRVIKLLWAFKDADNLDRVRVHDLNISYLRTATAKKLPFIAHLCYCENLFL